VGLASGGTSSADNLKEVDRDAGAVHGLGRTTRHFIAVASGLGMASGVVIADGSGIALGAAIGAAAGVVIGSVYQLIHHP